MVRVSEESGLLCRAQLTHNSYILVSQQRYPPRREGDKAAAHRGLSYRLEHSWTHWGKDAPLPAMSGQKLEPRGL